VELLSDPALYGDAAQAAVSGEEYRNVSEEIKVLTGEWEELSNEAEKVRADLLESIKAVK
jgi:hypothetical protein